MIVHRMSKSTASSCRVILHLGFGEHLVAKMAREEPGSTQVYFAAENLGQLLLQDKESQADADAGLEFNENVDIAVGSEVLA